MASPVIYNRGGPVQTAHPGPFTCTQSICSDTGCSDNSLQFECISQVMEGYDISFLGLTMECGGDTNGYPYLSCTCIEDFVNCDANGVIEGAGSPSIDGGSGYAAATTVVGKQAGSTQTTANSPTSTNAAQTCFDGGLGWQLRFGLLALVIAVLVL